MLNDSVQEITIEYDSVFRSSTKQLSHTNGLLDHLAHVDTKTTIKTNSSVWEEKAGVGIVLSFLNSSFSIRLPDLTPIFQAELFAIVLKGH